MKPNLFRSVSNALSQQFPLLPWIRRNLFGLIFFCVFLFIIGYSSQDGISVWVTPVQNGPFADRAVTSYPAGHVRLNGRLTITDPSVVERILLPDASSGIDLFIVSFLAIGSII